MDGAVFLAEMRLLAVDEENEEDEGIEAATTSFPRLGAGGESDSLVRD